MNADDNLDYTNCLSEVAEVARSRRLHDLPYPELMAQVPCIPTSMLWAFADDVATVLAARLGPGSAEAELVGNIVHLLTNGNDPIRFALCAILYERLGGRFSPALGGCYDAVGEVQGGAANGKHPEAA